MSNDILVIIEHLRGEVKEISYTLLAAAQRLAEGTGGEVKGVLLGSGVENLAQNLAADQVIYFDHAQFSEFTSDAYLQAIEAIINEYTPRAVLFGHTSIGMDVASSLSARADLPLISACLRFVSENSELRFTSQLYGGKVLAEGAVPGPISLLTVVPGGYKPEEGLSAAPTEIIRATPPASQESKITLIGYIEPEAADVDISTEPILVSVGRGIQLEDNIELAEELAQALGGAVCASRPVVDQGWLPTSRLVGKSGHQVKPKVYLALGISGAPEHTEGISGSDTIIAVNTDPAAPIFNIAKYGVVEDILDLIPEITEKLQKNLPV